jgi:DNA-binding NtrC family response regulator
MGNAGRTDLLSTKNGSRALPSEREAGMAAVKNLRAALDSVLILIETSTGSARAVAQGINFYDEVRDFEISLIRQALRHANGSQVRAAALLRLNPTTLNGKIKNYSIQCADPLRANELRGGLRVAGE